MATNRSSNGSDYPTRAQIQQMEDYQAATQKQVDQENAKIEEYKLNRPDMSLAQIRYNLARGIK